MIDAFNFQHDNIVVSSSPNKNPPLHAIIEKEDIIKKFLKVALS